MDKDSLQFIMFVCYKCMKAQDLLKSEDTWMPILKGLLVILQQKFNLNKKELAFCANFFPTCFSLDEKSCTINDFIYPEVRDPDIDYILYGEMENWLIEIPLLPSTCTRLKKYDMDLEKAIIIYAQHEAMIKAWVENYRYYY